MSEKDIENALVERLDKMTAILQLAFKEQLDSAREGILSDQIAAALIEMASSGWMEAGELKSAVAKLTHQSERTVSRRISTLVSQHVLKQEGTGPSVRYKSTGII
jgi:predicted HTH transcriptional regulator